jgi:transposase
LTRRLPVYSADGWRESLAVACARHARLGPATLVLYDVTTLYFETHQADGFREPGFSKERRLEPQITVGLLTDASGFPLMVNAFEGNKAETLTMLPTIRSFMAAHGLADVVIVADPGMISEANMRAIEAEGLSFILGMKIPEVPYVIDQWHKDNPDKQVPDGHVFTQPWPAGPTDKRRDQVRYYQYKQDPARRTLRGIDEQVRKAEKAVAGKIAVKRNRFVKLTNATKSVNRELEAKARALAGIKGYLTNLPDPTPELVIGAYHRLFQIEKSFRMAKSDLAARPIYHHTRDSIEAHLTIVFAALAVSRWIEETTGWSIRKFVKTVRRYRTIQIQAGDHTITAADPLPPDVSTVLEAIKDRAEGH